MERAGESSAESTVSSCPNPAPEKDLGTVRSFGVNVKVGICLLVDSQSEI